MTPQEFAATIEPPETLRRVALVCAAPYYVVAQWLGGVRTHLGPSFDSYAFRTNPMRLWCFIDGIPEPRLAITFHDTMAGQTPDNAPCVGAIIIGEISL